MQQSVLIRFAAIVVLMVLAVFVLVPPRDDSPPSVEPSSVEDSVVEEDDAPPSVVAVPGDNPGTFEFGVEEDGEFVPVLRSEDVDKIMRNPRQPTREIIDLEKVIPRQRLEDAMRAREEQRKRSEDVLKGTRQPDPEELERHKAAAEKLRVEQEKRSRDARARARAKREEGRRESADSKPRSQPSEKILERRKFVREQQRQYVGKLIGKFPEGMSEKDKQRLSRFRLIANEYGIEWTNETTEDDFKKLIRAERRRRD